MSLYQYNASNELTSSSLGSYTYDANGNTVSDAQGRSFTWDYENRLVQAVVSGANGGTTTFKYDPFGRRIQKSGPLGIMNFLYDGNGLIGQVDSSGNSLLRYTQTLNLDDPLALGNSTTTNYYDTDGILSISSFTSPTGATAGTYLYDSFGQLENSTGTVVSNSLRFSGREFDAETGLYSYRARYYDPSQGRFISQDPIGYNGGINVYRYVRNNPVLFIDPLGLCDTTRIKLWSSDEITINGPRAPWELSVPHQENADGILPINTLTCHWTREYNTTITTTTTYLVFEKCDCGAHRVYFQKEESWRTGTTTKTFDTGIFTPTGFDSEEAERLYCLGRAP